MSAILAGIKKILKSQHTLFALVFLLLLILTSRHLFQVWADADLWGHTKFGIEHIQTGQLAKVDPYSYTAQGNKWINHEWLSEYLFGWFYLKGGDTGLFWLRTLLVCLMAFSLLLLLWMKWAHGLFSYLMGTVLLYYLMAFSSNLRPHNFSFLLTLFVLICLEAYRVGKTYLIWLLPLVIAIWTNLHGGFVVGLALSVFGLLSLLLGGEDLSWRPTPSQKKTLLFVMILVLFAPFLNPYGIQLFAYLKMALSMPREYIREWQSISPLFIPHYFVFLILATVLLVLSKSWKRWTQTVFFLICAVEAYLNLRFVIFFILFAGLIIWESLVRISKRTEARGAFIERFNSPVPLVFLLIVASVVALPSVMKEAQARGAHVRIQSTEVPERAVLFLKENFLGPHLAITFGWGEYAIWHLSPHYLVSLDGRYETVYPVEYADKVLKAYSQGDVAGFLSGGKAQSILIEAGSKLDQALQSEQSWSEIYRDEMAVIYAHRNDFDPTQLESLKEKKVANKPTDFFP